MTEKPQKKLLETKLLLGVVVWWCGGVVVWWCGGVVVLQKLPGGPGPMVVWWCGGSI